MKGLQIIAWLDLAIAVYFTWPMHYTHFEFPTQHHEFDNYVVEINANGKLNYHRNKKGTTEIFAKVYSKKMILDDVILKSRKFNPQIDLKLCQRNRRYTIYCAGDIDQPFSQNNMIKGYTSYWSINHHLGNHNTPMQKTSYHYEIEICPQSSDCFIQSIVGELKGTANRYTQTSAVRLKNNIWLDLVYLCTGLVFIDYCCSI